MRTAAEGRAQLAVMIAGDHRPHGASAARAKARAGWDIRGAPRSAALSAREDELTRTRRR